MPDEKWKIRLAPQSDEKWKVGLDFNSPLNSLWMWTPEMSLGEAVDRVMHLYCSLRTHYNHVEHPMEEAVKALATVEKLNQSIETAQAALRWEDPVFESCVGCVECENDHDRPRTGCPRQRALNSFPMEKLQGESDAGPK